ncbi:MAG TPA: L-seryl-tRNA(Sec) selenium transferase [Pirellulales bacterium]|nr:L-seryl-tRNA(Sec) selenium transferase [Pirellulales bacterium]
MPSNLFRNIPSVNELLENPQLQRLVDKVSHHAVVSRVRTFLDDLRVELQNAAADAKLPTASELAETIARRILAADQPSLRPVINATGVLLHTGLGRAPLADEAIAEMAAAARDYASVELDLVSGRRSQRVEAVRDLLLELTGAEAALVVNNNAGATMLALAALAAGREVIVSRGQLIEIGGSYRLPDVMSASGAALREVGTTNKTRIGDYEAAINEHTAALMLVHPSNFVVVGFSESTSLAELVKLGRTRNLPVIHDIGSGAVIDFAEFGFSDEPLAAASIKLGADVALFSGDKLLGGPQCGIIVGKREHVDAMSRHPLARALRVDKLTLAALAATLRIYRNPERAKQSIPLLQFLSTPVENLKSRAERLAPQMAECGAIAEAATVADTTYLGGGSIPAQQLATWCVVLSPREMTVDKLAARLRTAAPSVVGRVRDDRLLLDLRTVFPRHDVELVAAVRALGDGETKAE